MGDVFVDGVLLGDRTVPGVVPAFDDRVVFAVGIFVVVIGDASSPDGATAASTEFDEISLVVHSVC